MILCVPLIGDQLCCVDSYTGAMKQIFLAVLSFYLGSTILIVIGAITSPGVVPVWELIKAFPAYRDSVLLVVWVTMIAVMAFIWRVGDSRASADQEAMQPLEEPLLLQDQRIWLRSVPIDECEVEVRRLSPPQKSLPAPGRD